MGRCVSKMGNEWIDDEAPETRSNNNYGGSSAKKVPVDGMPRICVQCQNQRGKHLDVWILIREFNGGRKWGGSVSGNKGRIREPRKGGPRA